MIRAIPPGETILLRAKSTVVVAPHFDDEVLGCGGLLAQLVAAGGAVRVLFLSDGGGMETSDSERQAYRERRRREAEAAVLALGAVGAEYLDLPDGELEHHRGAIGSALRRTLLAFRPGMLLAPSPLEGSTDHRAAFAAVHELLGPLRGDCELSDAVGDLVILLYEINHPAFPNVLVDVSAERSTIEKVMACYPSQLERHDYLAAALGLRRYRTLSLPVGVELAEAYVRLPARELALRSRSGLVEELGGRPRLTSVADGPLVSVVVRTRDRPALLAEALDSLAASTYRSLEVIVVNDGGATPSLPTDFPLELRLVDSAENRGRSAAANLGLAECRGEWVGFLDDDDLVDREHYAVLVESAVAGSDVVYSDAAVGVWELDGEEGWVRRELSLPYSRDFDPEHLLLDNYIPFHTLLISRELLVKVGPVDESLPFFEDWDLLIRLASLTPFQHLRRVTCEYRHFRGRGHHVLGERPQERGDFLARKRQVIDRYRDRIDGGLLARVVDRLREEAVLEHRGARDAKEALEELRRRHWKLHESLTRLQVSRAELEGRKAELEESYHRQHGEVLALRGERQTLQAAVAERDEALRGAQDREQDYEVRLSSLFAEIERLGSLISEMESTRAWRLHRFVERFKK